MKLVWFDIKPIYFCLPDTFVKIGAMSSVSMIFRTHGDAVADGIVY